MRIRMKADGRVFEGSPEEIVAEMRSVASRDGDALEDYMRWAADNLQAATGVTLPPEAIQAPDKFVEALLGQGLADRA